MNESSTGDLDNGEEAKRILARLESCLLKDSMAWELSDDHSFVKTAKPKMITIKPNPAFSILHGDCMERLKDFNERNFDLVIADPPYWKVIGEKWDYKWRTEADYIEWSRKWLTEVYRVLRFGGSFYLFGYFRMLVFLVPILQEIGFELRQQIVINKGMKAVAGRATKNYKMFPNVTESILFLVKDNKKQVKEILLKQQQKFGLKSKDINEALGVKSNGGGMWSIYTGKNVCEQFPTKELWVKLQNILKFKMPYETIAQTYNTEMGITDVWDDIDFYKEHRHHPTQKPLRLIDRLIKASSNKGDKVLDPFGGSGTTLISCINNNRNATIIELDKNYVKKIEERVKENLNLFNLSL
jgi:site-specific DNA-methyltransferase (adenine-specific)